MSKRLFVGGLPFSMDDKDLKEFFEGGDDDGGIKGCGADTVVEAKVICDRDTGKSRGFGFVEMTSIEEAENAIKLFNGTLYSRDGREKRALKVATAADRSTNSGGGRGGDSGGFRGGGRRTGGYNSNSGYGSSSGGRYQNDRDGGY